MRRWISTLLVAAVLVAGGVFWSQRHSSAAPVKYLTAAVTRGTVSQTVAATGTVQPQSTVSLTFGSSSSSNAGTSATAGTGSSPASSGATGSGAASAGSTAGGSQTVSSGAAVVRTVQAKVGDRVAAGVALATLDDSSQRSQVAVARAQLTAALTKQTAETDTTTATAVSSNAAAVAQAQAQLTTASAAVNATVLKAPLAGVVTAVNVSPGLPPPSGAALLVRSDGLLVLASVAEQDVPKLKTGLAARVAFPALSATAPGTLADLPTQANTAASGGAAAVTFPVTIALPTVPPGLLPGMSAQITVVIETRADVLTVPTSAIQGGEGNPTVQLLLAGKPVSKPVEIGLSTESATEVIAGIGSGQTVVTGVVNALTTPSTGGGGLGGGGGFRGGGLGGGGNPGTGGTGGTGGTRTGTGGTRG